MYNVCIFAGTTEGRELVALLSGRGNVALTACVATDYGETMLSPADNLTVLSGRMDEEEMISLMRRSSFDLVIDATHPYASAVTENISSACESTGCEYLRVLRDHSDRADRAVFVPDISSAVAFLDDTEGNILLTTGSKELSLFTPLKNFSDRVWARVLPMDSSLAACREAGLQPAHIIAMQGPFSEEMNIASLKAVNAAFLVTKDTGGAGGFNEKISAASAAGAQVVVIGRPAQKEGLGLSAATALICSRFSLSRPVSVDIVGIGPGSRDNMTAQVLRAVESADCLIGAKRMLRAFSSPGKGAFEAVSPDAICGFIRSHPEYSRFAVLMSGDTGFFSGAKKLLPMLEGCRTKLLPGLSSMSYLCSRLALSYEQAVPVSLHGRNADAVPYVRSNPLVFVLTGGERGVNELCASLTGAGLGSVKMHIGQRLSYPDESIVSGTASELAEGSYDSLSAVLIENGEPDTVRAFGLPDSAFIRADSVPMTKSEVRAVCMSKLRVASDSVCWDIGAGSGSVSVEMALAAFKGSVYAIEKKEDALRLLGENISRFGASNIIPVGGSAPEACAGLPSPSRVFIGGSGGNLKEIISLILEKNPHARIVATAVTLETAAELTACMKEFPFTETEAVSVSTAKGRKAGPYNLMTAQNPVFIFTFQAGEKRS
ncbi:MAG: precorrin-6A reductase [Oscillospiraceae bacterium]|nr:precorrin-6A reductase [Oscillospiraceae bacterium]